MSEKRKSGEAIEVYGARVHNLKNIDVRIPRNELVVITGLSGSGKSSLAFDVVHAEGQRRYIETLSAYARQFLGNMERPDVDKITGLSPVISIEQKTTNKNPRSTVGTITEVYDFLRLLYARASTAYSYNTNEPMVKYSDDQIIRLILEGFQGKKVYLLAPLVKGRKGHYRELFDQLRKKGFLYVRINGKITELSFGLKVDRYKTHHIELVVDKMVVNTEDKKRLKDSVQLAMKLGHNVLMINEFDTDKVKFFSKLLMCPSTGISYNEPAPHTFSFNSPQGACPNCNGLGKVSVADRDKIIPDTANSIKKGGIEPLGKYSPQLIFWKIEAILTHYGCTIDTPIKDIPEEAMKAILEGSDQPFKLQNNQAQNSSGYFLSFDGVMSHVMNLLNDEDEKGKKNGVTQFIQKALCPDCKGARLKKESLWFKFDGKTIAEICAMDISDLKKWLEQIEERIEGTNKLIAGEILKEVRGRVSFLHDVGLDYLSLSRSSGTLSGGESQRIRLATQIGSQLVNVLYILDEPSIGLHQRDNHKLIHSLKELRDKGNSIVVVEHDKDTIMASDYVIDIGPFAGKQGGEVIASGSPEEILKAKTITADYLNNRRAITIPNNRRPGNGQFLSIKGAKGNNLKDVEVHIPLGLFNCVTGVSGSGKSSLINGTLYPILSQHFYRSTKQPLPYKTIKGIEHIDKVIDVSQAPIGRTPRSNPATYTGMFSDIRNLFALTAEAKIRGFKPGRFSFNVKGGRCEVCRGGGLQVIEMNFLPDVYVECNECRGKRYNKETLAVRYKQKNINEVLNLTINQAAEFFSGIPHIYKKLEALQQVGLGYVTLGQPSTTLSGGESQRVKLATELAKKDTGQTLYIFDEPTTGLHFEDVNVLLGVLQKLVDKGNTVLVIEHNLDVIKVADHIIDIGPNGGIGGGQIIAEGTPESIVKKAKGYTYKFLEDELN